MNRETLLQVQQTERQRVALLKDRILCCAVAGCLAGGAGAVRDALVREGLDREASGEIEVCGTGCMGLCSQGPLVRSSAANAIYTNVTPADAPAIFKGTHTPAIGPEHPFFAGQRRIILANSGHTDPERISDYIAAGGYQSLLRAVTEMTPEEIVAGVRRSGLRGRGGAGYPAGLKWELVARQRSTVKYVVCNADEGDPGAFMNRAVLEGDPHRVLEGMAIAGRAVGASQGYVYVRGESPLAVARLRTALEQARREGLLGERIFESGFNFRIDLRIGGGVPAGYEFKAAQTGGPAGGCIPAIHLDLPMNYDSLRSIGAIMGSGGLIVMDTSTCMVDVARFFMEFCRDESCGKCIPCRAGTVQMHDILARITRGEGVDADFGMLEELSGLLRAASLCGLGIAAPNPVMSTLRHFRREYEAQVREHRCPAGHCSISVPSEVPA